MKNKIQFLLKVIISAVVGVTGGIIAVTLIFALLSGIVFLVENGLSHVGFSLIIITAVGLITVETYSRLFEKKQEEDTDNISTVDPKPPVYLIKMNAIEKQIIAQKNHDKRKKETNEETKQ